MLTDEMRQNLIEVASTVRKWAYAPYSNYQVGAALLTASGRIYDGVNVENAAYPDSICAERVAVFKAVSEGELKFEAIAVVTQNSAAPCGSCRQALAEFGLDIVVLIADDTGQLQQETTVDGLLPNPFVPADLNTET